MLENMTTNWCPYNLVLGSRVDMKSSLTLSMNILISVLNLFFRCPFPISNSFSFECTTKYWKHLLIMIFSNSQQKCYKNIQSSVDLLQKKKDLIKQKYVDEWSHDLTFHQTVFHLSHSQLFFFFCLNTCNTIFH